MKRVAAAASLCMSLLALSACASDGPPVTSGATLVKSPPIAAPTFGSGEEDAILRAVDRFLLAVGNHDTEALKDAQVAEGTTFAQQRTKSEAKPVQRRSNADFAKPNPNADYFIERYWNPTVQVRGDIAQVWAPYELRNNGQVVHCGVDAFDLVKLDGKWRVGNVMFTMEPDACGEIQPPAVSDMRPRDGWKEAPNN
ncbi:MAG TPA: hypothetical protein VG942_16350 [Hyphomonadaceae bacterium]|nr:hypothetical protein [Hyphomonadaceae bacterium]